MIDSLTISGMAVRYNRTNVELKCDIGERTDRSCYDIIVLM